jgi:hypothetical protein
VPPGVVADPCDQDGDRSPSLDDPGPWAFGCRIQKLPFLPRFRPPTNIAKYTGVTNPAVWLEDFRFACRDGGADDDYFIILYLPICVGENVRARQSLDMSLLGISRGLTCILETPGTSRAANKSLASPCGTTFAGSPSNGFPP